jgi:hypothetical protein
MDLRWIAYVGSGLLAAVSIVPASIYQRTDAGASAPAGRVATAADARVDTRLLDVARQTDRLARHVRSAPAPRAAHRNPFEFGGRPPAAPSPAAPVAPSEALAIPPAAPVPALALVGLTERRIDDTVVRTAVLVGFDDVHLAGVGHRIANRFEVVAIDADAVDLRELATGEMVRLHLR